MNTKIRAVLLLLFVALVSAAAAFALSQPSVGASFQASDVETTTHDGEIDAVSIAPKGMISWTGLEEDPDGATVIVSIKTPDGEWKTVASKEYDRIDGLDGSLEYSFDSPGHAPDHAASNGAIDLTERGFSDHDFEASDGATEDTTIDVRIIATIDAQDQRSTTISDSFTVSVENKQADAHTTGSAGTGVSSSSEVDS